MAAGVDEGVPPGQRQPEAFSIPGDVGPFGIAHADCPWAGPLNEVAVDHRPVGRQQFDCVGTGPNRRPRILGADIPPDRLDLPRSSAVEDVGIEARPHRPARRHAGSRAKPLGVFDVGQVPLVAEPLRKPGHVDHAEALPFLTGKRMALDAAERPRAREVPALLGDLGCGESRERRQRSIGFGIEREEACDLAREAGLPGGHPGGHRLLSVAASLREHFLQKLRSTLVADAIERGRQAALVAKLLNERRKQRIPRGLTQDWLTVFIDRAAHRQHPAPAIAGMAGNAVGHGE